MTPDLMHLMTTQGNVFTAKQSERAGVTAHERATLLRTGTLIQLRDGIFTTRELFDASDPRGKHRIHAAGALLARGWCPDAEGHRYIVGRRSAAFLHGLPFLPDTRMVDALNAEGSRGRLSPELWAMREEVLQIWRGEGPWHVDLISADRCRRTYRNGVDVRPAAIPPGHTALDEGVPISSLARTAVDLMRDGSMAGAVMAADGALHLGTPRPALEEVAQFCATWSHGHQALEAVAFANGLAESPAESLARWVCSQEKRLVRPEPQVDIYDRGDWIARVDLLFRRFRVVLEVDGRIKYSNPWCGDSYEALRRQHEREARLRTAGWIVIRTTWEELMTNPEGLIRRLIAACAQAA